MVDVKYAMYKTEEDYKAEYNMPRFVFEEPMFEQLKKAEEKAYIFMTPYI